MEWTKAGTVRCWYLHRMNSGHDVYDGPKRMDQAVAVLCSHGRRCYALGLRREIWVILDHLDPLFPGMTRTGPSARERAEAEVRALNHDELAAHE